MDDDDDIGMTPWTDRSKKQPTAMQRQTAIDITADELLPRLSVQNVADLVLLSMVSTSFGPCKNIFCISLFPLVVETGFKFDLCLWPAWE